MRLEAGAPVLVVGAGVMGAGIAQVAAQAGHPVQLFDAREGAAAEARARLEVTLQGLAAKGRITPESAAQTLGRIRVAASLEPAADAALVVEAIVEDLDAKRALLRQLEAVVGPDCVLASNTSSISINALARGLRHPQRVVGMHFFNPVPLMKLVEVVSGLQTDEAVAEAVFALAQGWGKVAVHARSTPGFIVNRIARPFYAESLSLLQERVAEPAQIDACLRGAGFRMGPCELMDLIGHDVNFAVTCSVFDANFGDRRYGPSWLQREMVEAGLLGRKTGRGFFDHGAGSAAAPPGAGVGAGSAARPAAGERGATAASGSGPADGLAAPAQLPPAARIVLHGQGRAVEGWAQALQAAGRAFERSALGGWSGLQADGAQLRLCDGRPAARVAAEEGVRDLALFDQCLPPGGAPGSALAWSAADGAGSGWRQDAAAWLRLAGWQPCEMADTAGLPVGRILAMLINEAADAVLQGVCGEASADAAMKLGVNHPAGPFEWLAAWGPGPVVRFLDHLDEQHRGERYRVSPALRQRAWRAVAPGATA